MNEDEKVEPEAEKKAPAKKKAAPKKRDPIQPGDVVVTPDGDEVKVRFRRDLGRLALNDGTEVKEADVKLAG